MDDIWTPEKQTRPAPGAFTPLGPVATALVALQVFGIGLRVLSLGSETLLQALEPDALVEGPASLTTGALAVVFGLGSLQYVRAISAGQDQRAAG